MTNDERLKKLRKLRETEEKSNCIFFISLGVFFLMYIITSLSNWNLCFVFIMFILFCVIMISFAICMKSHYSYKKLLNESMRANNIKPIITQKPVKNYTINYVMEGKYKNEKIINGGDMLLLDGGLTKRYISSYTVIEETNKEQYSFWKGALGVALFGGFGAAAGIGGKNRKEYLIAIEWKDGEKSLILIDDEYYKVFVQSMF